MSAVANPYLRYCKLRSWLSNLQRCVFTSESTNGNFSHYNFAGNKDACGHKIGIGTAGLATQAINMFTNRVPVWNQVGALIPDIDTRNAGVGPTNGTPYLEVDMSAEQRSAALKFTVIFSERNQSRILGNPTMNLSSSSYWGVQNTQANTPRKMWFGMRASL